LRCYPTAVSSGRLTQALGMPNRPSLIQTLALAIAGVLSAYVYIRLFEFWGVADRPFVRLAGGAEGGFFLASLFSLCLFSFLVAAILIFFLSRVCGSYFNFAAVTLCAAFTVCWLVLAVTGGTAVVPGLVPLLSFVALFALSALFARRVRHA